MMEKITIEENVDNDLKFRKDLKIKKKNNQEIEEEVDQPSGEEKLEYFTE